MTGKRIALAQPRTTAEFDAAERLEALGYLTLNPDGTITPTAKGLAAEEEFTTAVLAALEAEQETESERRHREGQEAVALQEHGWDARWNK